MNANEFEEIRPYKDDELQHYLLEIINDKSFLKVIDYLFLSKMNKVLAWCIRPFIKPFLKFKARKIKTIQDFQLKYVKEAVEELIARNISSITLLGVENIDNKKNYTFMSNHVDIVMDSAFLNYEIHKLGFQTVQIAIGDNLLDIKFVEHLSRLNKAFKVIRNVGSGRLALKTFMQLSSYIHHSIDEGENIWIAQKEGRSKDNIFDTDPSIIKMLHLSKRENGMASSINSLHIIPLSISYEYDPCDYLKAREIVQTREAGSYTKSDYEDFDSIATGMKGYRGEVVLHFGKQIVVSDDMTADDIANQITIAIKKNYKIMKTNIAGFELFFGKQIGEFGYAREQIEQTRRDLLDRIAGYEPEIQQEILKNYATPLVEQLKLV